MAKEIRDFNGKSKVWKYFGFYLSEEGGDQDSLQSMQKGGALQKYLIVFDNRGHPDIFIYFFLLWSFTL